MSALDHVRSTRSSDLSPTLRWVYTCVAVRGDSSGAPCWASVETLCADTGFAERTLQLALRELTELGWLRREARPGRSTVYVPLGDPRSRCTPAAGAPPQQVHPTPAPGAPAPAPGAPDQPIDLPSDQPEGGGPPPPASNDLLERAAVSAWGRLVAADVPPPETWRRAAAADRPAQRLAVLDELVRCCRALDPPVLPAELDAAVTLAVLGGAQRRWWPRPADLVGHVVRRRQAEAEARAREEEAQAWAGDQPSPGLEPIEGGGETTPLNPPLVRVHAGAAAEPSSAPSQPPDPVPGLRPETQARLDRLLGRSARNA